MLWDALRVEGGDELDVLDLGVVGATHDLQEVVELRGAGERVLRVLQRPQLYLALQVEGAREKHLVEGLRQCVVR